MSGLSRPFAKPLVLALLLGLCALAGPVAGDEEKAKAPEPGVPDPELQKAIDEAIDGGVAWLKGEQSPSGAMGGIETTGSAVLHHEIGASALCGLALLAGGVKKGEPAVDNIYRFLVEKDLLFGSAGGRSTYDTGILLMFVTAYARGDESEQAGRGARPKRGGKNPCDMTKDDKRWVQDLASWLVRQRKPASSTWGYPQLRDDHSNTQYAFLGLRAARDCGATVPAMVFVQAAETFLERQEQDGPKVPRFIPSPGEGANDYAIDMGDRARGWSYMQEPFMTTGAMTTSGIAVLAICHDALTNPQRSSKYTGKMERAVTRGVQDGFAWLDKNWSVKDNPGLGPAWHLYYMYGLERASVFGGRDLLGSHDWYVEGSRVLVDMQKADGRWATGQMGTDGTFQSCDVVDSAWAILFLARATRPMPPINAPVVTEGD